MNENNTKKCKFCKSDIDKKAKICPVCKKKQKAHGCLLGIIIAILAIVLIAIAIGSGSKTPDSENNTDASPVQQSTTTENNSSSQQDSATSKIPTEYKSALNKAKLYSDTMYMSKQGIYDQLTSEYGEKFSAEAAQYAIDNLNADWNKNALEKAKIYQETMSMSPSAIYDQLISEYGEKFTAEQAQYAIDHLE